MNNFLVEDCDNFHFTTLLGCLLNFSYPANKFRESRETEQKINLLAACSVNITYICEMSVRTCAVNKNSVFTIFLPMDKGLGIYQHSSMYICIRCRFLKK
jgi:hypothetical protein